MSNTQLEYGIWNMEFRIEQFQKSIEYRVLSIGYTSPPFLPSFKGGEDKEGVVNPNSIF
jgi:hypothetical protein